MLLAGDIGGTKTNLALYTSELEIRTPKLEAKFPSAQYPSLQALVRDFFKQATFPVERAVFGVAGPVVEGKARITNLPWLMDEQQLQEDLNIPSVQLLNDLDALAHAVPLLKEGDLHTLNVGQPVLHSALGVIAPGTGLGEAFLTWDGTRYRTHPSEGGHADFAPTDLFEIDLLRFMLRQFEHVSYELVCSGIGLPNVYNSIKAITSLSEPEWLAEELKRTTDPTRSLINAGLLAEQAPDLCVVALRTWTTILGAEAGNLALKVLATGGIYVGGGIPPRILPYLDRGEFMLAFKNKGRFSDLLAQIPVHVILNPEIGLMGAAYHGFIHQ